MANPDNSSYTLDLRSSFSTYLIFGSMWALPLLLLVLLAFQGKHSVNGVVVCAIGMVLTLYSVWAHRIALSQDQLFLETIFGKKKDRIKGH
jgi:hypothetical protein